MNARGPQISESLQRFYGTAERNRIIMREIADGAGFQELGDRFGISRQRVEQVYRRDRHNAREGLKRAFSLGKVDRPNKCQGCAAPEVQAHHDDYADALNVRWLCHECHAKADMWRRRQNGERRRSTVPAYERARIRRERKRFAA